MSVIVCRTCNRGTGLLIPVYPFVEPHVYDCFPCLWGELIRNPSSGRWAEIREQLEHAFIETPGLPIEKPGNEKEIIQQLQEALHTALVGGNHLASNLIGELGPKFLDEYAYPANQTALKLVKRGNHSVTWMNDYEQICTWRAMMEARDMAQKALDGYDGDVLGVFKP